MLTFQVDPDVYVLVRVFNYTHTLCMSTAKALLSLCICAESLKPLLLEDAIYLKFRVLAYMFIFMSLMIIIMIVTLC